MDNIKADSTPFETCTICKTTWDSRSEFLGDPNIELIGYQVHFKKLTAGLLYFNHSCKGTLAFYADAFMDLYSGPVFIQRATHTENCPGHCLHKGDLEPCPAQCECASVRAVLQIIKAWPKHPELP